MLLNLRSGRWYALNTTAALLCRELRTGGLETAVQAVKDRHPSVGEGRIRRDAEEMVQRLADRNLVVFETPEASTVPGTGPPIVAGTGSGRYRLRARLALVLVTLLLCLPFRWTLRAAAALRVRGRTAATTEEAAAMVHMIDRVAKHFPGRVACLEQSLAAVLTAWLSRRRLTWVMGVAEDPYRFHAWVESEGVPVLPAEEPGFSGYRRVLTL